MLLTQEQQTVVDYCKTAQEGEEDVVILINAIAGAGKTALLTEIVKQVPHTKGIYLAYNKSVAVEAGSKFPRTISCSTVHSLAYRAIVSPLKLKVGNFSYKTIKESISYEEKQYLQENIREFCLSSYVDFEKYCKDKDIKKHDQTLCSKYLNLMYEGKIECTHDFYLKAFHIHLANGEVVYPKQDFVLIDESGDLNEVSLAVFRLLPAKIKIAVGDNCQNIYGFNHTINAFTLMKDEGTLFNLTKSFRVEKSIAERIEKFCKKHIDQNMVFEGVELEDKTVKTEAYLSRTNAGMISAMIELTARNKPFSTVRKPAEIFKLPLALIFAKYQGEISEPAYKHLQADIDEWYETPELHINHKTPLMYIGSLYSFDITLSAALSLVVNKGRQDILAAYEFAKKHEGKRHTTWLGTCHSVKGLEFDSVTLTNDLNNSASKALGLGDAILPEEEERVQELNLYYVACSRAKKYLYNATMLEV